MTLFMITISSLVVVALIVLDRSVHSASRLLAKVADDSYSVVHSVSHRWSRSSALQTYQCSSRAGRDSMPTTCAYLRALKAKINGLAIFDRAEWDDPSTSGLTLPGIALFLAASKMVDLLRPCGNDSQGLSQIKPPQGFLGAGRETASKCFINCRKARSSETRLLSIFPVFRLAARLCVPHLATIQRSSLAKSGKVEISENC